MTCTVLVKSCARRELILSQCAYTIIYPISSMFGLLSVFTPNKDSDELVPSPLLAMSITGCVCPIGTPTHHSLL